MEGPARVVKRLSPYTYRVAYRRAVLVVHHDRMKLCTDRTAPVGRGNIPGNNQEKVYCTCRGPDDGSLMVQCDQCDEWYHGRCVEITPDEAADLGKYYCSACCARWQLN